MATAAEERLRAREEARLRRARARVAALRRANRRLPAHGPQAPAGVQEPGGDAAPPQALQKALAGLGEAVLIVDAATLTIVDCNRAATELLGCERGDLLGQAVEGLRGVQARGPGPAVILLTASGTAGPRVRQGSTRAPARRRASAGQAGGQPAGLKAGSLALDRETNVARVAGPGERQTALTPSEAGLLALLMERPGRVWSCRDLARLALGYDVLECEAVEIVRPHISRLRQKLEPDPLQPRLIRTVRGQGYLLSP